VAVYINGTTLYSLFKPQIELLQEPFRYREAVAVAPALFGIYLISRQ
jgi:hypothetical protein